MNHHTWEKPSIEPITAFFDRLNKVLHINNRCTPINPVKHSALTKREEQYERSGKPNRK